MQVIFLNAFAGQDLLPQHNNPNGAEMNGSITNDHLLSQSPANTGMTG